MSAFIDNKRETVIFSLLGVALAGLLTFLVFAWPGFSGNDETTNTGDDDAAEQEVSFPELLPHSEDEVQQALDLAHAFTTEYLTVDGSEDHSERQERLAQFCTPSYAEFLRNETPPAAAQDRSAADFRSESRTQEASISELDADSLTFTMRTTSIRHDAEDSHQEDEEYLLTVELVSGEWGVSSLRSTEEEAL